MKIAILNVGFGGWHPKGSDRLKRSVENFHDNIDLIIWKNSYPENSPTHKEIPYAFKTYAFLHAMKMGYDIAFWFDSSIYLKKSMQPAIDMVKNDGHFVLLNGWTPNDWLCDNQVEHTGHSREELKQMKLCIAGAVGFDLHKYGDMLLKWNELSKHFKGEWVNTGECSCDKSVLGSRHDQSFLSVICHDNGITFRDCNSLLSYNINDDVIFAAQGM